jgi:hypothetical protein
MIKLGSLVQEKQVTKREKNMRKQSKKNENEMMEENDFSKGIRGKYAKKYAAGNNIVVLEPDVGRFFKDSSVVNETLRNLLKIGHQVSKTAL